MTALKVKKVPRTQAQRGDIADHNSGQLDPRRVTKIDGDQVWLMGPGGPMGPFPAMNYTYSRYVEAAR